MNPNLSVGIFNQTWWPGNGGKPYDDCWALADLMAVHGVAPWLNLPTIIKYRAAAGNPDAPGVSDGGTIDQSAKAILTLYPKIAAHMHVAKGDSWDDFKARMTYNNNTASLSLLSGALPSGQAYGFKGTHRVAVALLDSGWKIANPLGPPHGPWRDISEAELKKAVDAYPRDGVWALVMPSVETAFKDHPLNK